MRMGDSCLTSRNWAHKQPQSRECKSGNRSPSRWAVFGGENDQHSSLKHGLKFLMLYPYRWANLVFHPMVKWWSVETAVFGQSCCATCWSTIRRTSTTVVRPIKLDYYETSSGRFRCVFFSSDRPKKGLTYFQKTLYSASDWPPIAGAFTTREREPLWLWTMGPTAAPRPQVEGTMTRDSSPPRRERCWLEEERWLKARHRPGWGWSNHLMDFAVGFSQPPNSRNCVFKWLPQQCQACQFMVYSWHCRLVWWLYRSLPNRNLTHHWTVVLWSQCFGLKLTESLGTTLQQPRFKCRLQSRNISEFPFNRKTSLNQILRQLVHVFLRRRCNGRRTICWSYANSWEA